MAGMLFFQCSTDQKTYRIAGTVEEPQHEIIRTITDILNQSLRDSIHIKSSIGMAASLDSLEAGLVDFAIVDNLSDLTDNVRTIIPLYPQILHVLHRRSESYETIESLLVNNKIYAGAKGSGTYRFVRSLMRQYGLSARRVTFVSDLELFEADVIFSFTDLLSNDELRDLSDYELFSFDDVENYGKGSLVEGLCTIYPQFEPYILAKDVYGDYTKKPILTLRVGAVLVGNAQLPKEVVYDIVQALDENKQRINNINPLLYDFSGVFDPANLNYKLHEGSRNYLNRYEPSFLEKYAEVFSVIISIFVALASAFFTITSWQRTKKKNKIDVYYQKIVRIRAEVEHLTDPPSANKLIKAIKNIQEETIELVVREKLLADETFSIFLNLSKLVTEEIKEKKSTLLKV